MRLTLVLLLLCSCSPVTHTDPVVNWSLWNQQDGAVVFVSDKQVGAMTFIVVGGEVEFAVGDGVAIQLMSLSPEHAVFFVEEDQYTLTMHESVRINNVTILLDSIVIREN